MVADLRVLTAGAFLATLLLWLVRLKDLPESVMAAYEPFAWLCYNVPLFVIEHERWIDITAAVVGVLRAFSPPRSEF